MLTEIGSVENVEPYIHEKLQKKKKSWDLDIVYIVKVIHVRNILKIMSKKLTELTGHPEYYEMSMKIYDIVTGEKKSTTKC